MTSAYEAAQKHFGLAEHDVGLNYIVSKNLDFTLDIASGQITNVGNVLPHTPYIDFSESHEIDYSSV